MCKKFVCFISFVLLLGLVGNASEWAGQTIGTQTPGSHSYDPRRALSDAEIKALVPPQLKAWEPTPADGAINQPKSIIRWQPGETALAHDVYFGTDRTAVENADTSSPECIEREITVLYSIVAVAFQSAAKTYYWRVDEVEFDGITIHKGDVWTFSTAGLKAHTPIPADGSLWQDPNNTLLWWGPGFTSRYHELYFGSDWAIVLNANTSTSGIYKGRKNPPYNPGPLAKNTTYYWRVDEVESVQTIKHKGDIWSFKTAPPVVLVTESGGSTIVSEDGPTSDNFTVVLGSQPNDNVIITVAAEPTPTACDISLNTEPPSKPISLVFTPADWNTPHTVTVWAVDDYYCEGTETAVLTFYVSSSDPNFDKWQIPPLSVTIIDNDTCDVVIVETDYSTEVIEEGLTSDEYTVELKSWPTADVKIYLEEIADPHQVVITPTLLVFTSDNWSIPQTVTVTAIDDSLWEPNPHYTAIKHTIVTDDTMYKQVHIGNVSVLIYDNDRPDVQIRPVAVLIDPATTSEVRTMLPDSVPAVVQGSTYYLEIWASDTGKINTGLTSVYIDVSFCQWASALAVKHGTIFITFPDGNIQPGGVNEFGGSALPSGDGIEPNWVRVGWIQMSGTTIEACTISLLPSSTGVAALDRGLISWDQIDLGSVELEITPAAKSYDLDSDGFIGVGDLSLFAGSWQEPVPPANAAHDFDCDVFVGVGDLSWFATGWMKYTNDPTILYVACPTGGGGVIEANREILESRPLNTSFVSVSSKALEGLIDVSFEVVVLDAPSEYDTTTVLPSSIDIISNGQTYYLEVWATDAGYVNTGLISAYVDVTFPADTASVRNISHGGIFTGFPDGSAVSGLIEDLGGSTLSQGVGVEPWWVRVAVVQMHADLAPRSVTFTLLPSNTGVSAYGRGSIPWDNIWLGSVTIPEPNGDIDIDGDVDFVDYAGLAGHWGDETCIQPNWCERADLNKSGSVDLYDLYQFAEHWLEGSK